MPSHHLVHYAALSGLQAFSSCNNLSRGPFDEPTSTEVLLCGREKEPDTMAPFVSTLIGRVVLGESSSNRKLQPRKRSLSTTPSSASPLISPRDKNANSDPRARKHEVQQLANLSDGPAS